MSHYAKAECNRQKMALSLALSLWMAALDGATAQNDTLDWFTTSGGGGTSTGGVYSVSGTIGQTDAGSMSGGNYTLTGGFWPGVLMVPSAGGAPTLFIRLTGVNVTIGWSPLTPGFVLEQTSDLWAPAWSAAPAGNPVTIPVADSAQFYRLRKL